MSNRKIWARHFTTKTKNVREKIKFAARMPFQWFCFNSSNAVFTSNRWGNYSARIYTKIQIELSIFSANIFRLIIYAKRFVRLFIFANGYVLAVQKYRSMCQILWANVIACVPVMRLRIIPSQDGRETELHLCYSEATMLRHMLVTHVTCGRMSRVRPWFSPIFPEESWKSQWNKISKENGSYLHLE